MRLVSILVFVNKDVREAVLVLAKDRGKVSKKFDGVKKEVIKIKSLILVEEF